MGSLDKNLSYITPELLNGFSPAYRQTIYSLLNMVEQNQELYILFDIVKNKVYYSFIDIGSTCVCDTGTYDVDFSVKVTHTPACNKSLLTWDRLLAYEAVYGKS